MKKLLVSLLCLAAFAAVIWQQRLASQPAVGGPDAGVTFRERPCTAKEHLDIDVRCGLLVVPEDYDDLSGLSLQLPVVMVGPLNQDRMAMVLGGGGPGGRAVSVEQITSWDIIRNEVYEVYGEVGLIVAEQRGVGEKYRLRCPGLIELREWMLSRELTHHEEFEAITYNATKCRDHFQHLGIDLRHYTTRNSAKDFDNLRRVLAIRKLDLIGTSYAGMIAFEMIGKYPESVNLALLDSPAIPERTFRAAETKVDLTFDRLAEQCLESDDCGGIHGDMRASMITVLDRLEDAPLLVPHSRWTTLPNDGSRDIVLTRDRFASAVIHALYYDSYTSLLPEFLGELSRTGNSGFLSQYALNLFESTWPEDVADGLTDTIFCREFIPYTSYDEPGQTGIAWTSIPQAEIKALMERYCYETWNAGPPIPTEPPQRISHPVLILSGATDPITPGSIAAELAGRFHSVEHVTVPGAHGVLGSSCGRYAARKFIENPRREVHLRRECMQTDWWK